MTFTKNRLYIGIAIVFVVLILFWLLFRDSAVTVETAETTRGQMLVTVDGEGKTRFRDKVTVNAPVSGKMSRIQIGEGDLIPKEYVITEVDPNPPTPRPPSETENRPNPYALKVYAPISGRVLRIFEKSERILQAGTPIIEVGNPNTVEIVIDVLSTEAAQIRAGSAVLVTDASSAEPIKARVRIVEPQAFTKVSALGVEEQRVNIIADFLTKEISFGDNFRIDVRIIVWQSENILKIPSSALFREGEKWNVFVIESGNAKRREVKIGHQNSSESEVLEGLSEGETVILHPPNQLADGAPVAVQ
ncbi:MAG TPA: HlyD family efflux transporter periplasmic adaptor subunit [Pyrinomonadaceae bacterium]|jgi:multidrug efflux pump subunit AcrA (membrane-fusion protein)|nr:HlyD family efflux transporter periplasmic adaptor subunit [Pyrinomonadaceae bacterium]